jgi:hypothetical protein
MPEPTSHTAAAVALSGVWIYGWPLFWAFLGAVCWQAAYPPSFGTKKNIVSSAAVAIISTVLGTLGSRVAASTAMHFFEWLVQVDRDVLIALPAFLLGLLGHLLLLRGAELIREFRKGT